MAGGNTANGRREEGGTPLELGRIGARVRIFEHLPLRQQMIRTRRPMSSDIRKMITMSEKT